jgi:competence protein ComEC
MPARPLPVLAVSLLLGSLTGAASIYLPVLSILGATLLLGFLFILTASGRCKPAFTCLIYLLFLCGLVSAALTQARTTSPAIPYSTGTGKFDLIGEIAEPVRYGPSRAAAIVSLRRLLTTDHTVPVDGRIRLTMRGNVPSLVVGDVIRFQSRLRPPHSQSNPGGFDYETYLLHHRIQAGGSINLGSDGKGIQLLTHVTYPVLDRADGWRGRIREAALRTLDSPAASVYLALITGETGYLSQDVRDDFMSSGTTHILSISGSNLGLIGVVVFLIARRAILMLPYSLVLYLTLRITPTKAAAALTMPVVGFYAILGGAEVATVRSLLMLGLLLGAVLLGRTHHLGTGLAFAALIIIAWDPLAPMDLSFQLSFLSVLAIVVLASRERGPLPIAPEGISQEDVQAGSAGRLLSNMRSVLQFLGKSGGELVLLGVAVTMVTVPLVAMHFHQIAWVGLIANLLIVPFVGFLVVPLGLLGCVATLLSGSHSLLCATPIQAGLDTLLWMVHVFAALPGARWMVASPSVWQVGVFYLCVAGLFWSSSQRVRYVSVVVAAVLLGLWVWSPRDLPEKESVRLTFLDVGQGDAAVIETSEGPVMLVDGGGAFDSTDQGRAVIAPFLWNRGIRRLDVVVATHPQLDHIGGLTYVAREFTIGELWTNGIDRDLPFVHRLDQTTKERRIPVRAVTSVDLPFPLGSCRIHILNPAPPLSPSPSRGESRDRVNALPALLGGKHLNNESVVVRLACGSVSVLFTGDIEQEAEERLVSGYPLGSGVLKVPHHGSRGSLHELFLRTVNPDVAVVSVGRGNSYGHPAPAMLDMYRRLNIGVLRTDRDGAVTIVQSPSRRLVACERARRLKAVAPGRTGSWKRERDNLRRLWSAELPCMTEENPTT